MNNSFDNRIGRSEGGIGVGWEEEQYMEIQSGKLSKDSAKILCLH